MPTIEEEIANQLTSDSRFQKLDKEQKLLLMDNLVKTRRQSGPPRPSRGAFEAIGEHFQAGLEQTARGREEFLRPQSYTRSLLGVPIFNYLMGTMGQVGAPITGPISAWASRPAGGGIERLTGSPTAGQITELSLDAILPLLLDPTIPAGPLAAASRGIRSLRGPPVVAPKLTQAMEALARAETPGRELLQAEEELAKATGQTREAMISAARPGPPPPLSPDLLQAERELGKQTGLTRERVTESIAARRQAGQLARQAETRIPTEAQARTVAEGISPTRLTPVEAGQFGAEAFKKQKKIAEVPFNKAYTKLEGAYGNQLFRPENALQAKQRMTEPVEALERGLRTPAERLAASPIGEMAKLSDEEIAERVSDLVRTAGQIEARTGRMPDWLSPDKLERWANVRAYPEMTFGDMIRARRRFGAAARGAREGGDLALERQYLELKNAYHADIAKVDSGKADSLNVVDRVYATKFIPRYGFESPAGTAARNVGEGEGFLPSIFKRATPQTKDDLITVTQAKKAFTSEDWNVLSRSFTEDLIKRSFNDAGEFDPLKFRRVVGGYRSEMLNQAFGETAKKNLDLFGSEMAESLRLKRAALRQGQIATEMETQAKAQYKTAERSAGQRYEELEKERLKLLDQIRTGREKTAKGAFEAETVTRNRFLGLQQEQATNIKQAEQQLRRVEAELAKEKSGIFSRAQRRMETAGALVGPVWFFEGILELDPRRMMRGAALTVAGPIVQLLNSRHGRRLLGGTGRMIAGSGETIVRAAEIRAFVGHQNEREAEQIPERRKRRINLEQIALPQPP